MESYNREYSNGEIIVYWKPRKCIHSTICYTELIKVFNPTKRPWIDMKGSSTEKIIEIVNKCPTDALTYKRINPDNQIAEPGPDENNELTEIKVMKDGPIVVKGNFNIIGGNKDYRQYKMISFCRCGASKDMPLCDGTHQKIGFKDKE